MEILPGIGVELARIGELRVDVERRIGRPVHDQPSERGVYATTPMLIISYDENDVVELVEIAHGNGRKEASIAGVRLTWRFLDDVVADLRSKGYSGRPNDIGFVFDVGFAVFSMHSHCARDLDRRAAVDDERAICEGVSIAPRSYFETVRSRSAPLPYAVHTTFQRGDRVLHTTFGEGYVRACLPNRKVRIEFPSGLRVLVHATASK